MSLDSDTVAARSSGNPMRFLQPDVLTSLGNLELLAKTVVDGVLTGLHRSPHFGFSQEFAEYRSYNEGDDLRFVDWNVYARTDRTYIKRFLGDTNTSLTLLIDASASMAFGSGSGPVSKFQYARFLAASLAYLTKKQHDAVGAIIFDDSLREVLQPSSRPDALYRVFSALEKHAPSSNTDVELAIDALHTVAPRRGLIAVISDFYTEPEKLLASLQPLVQRQQDIVLFHVMDPMEVAPEYASVVEMRDMETDERLDVDPAWLKEEYQQLFSAHCDALEKTAMGVGADYVKLPTDQPLDAALQRYLLFRQRKL